MLVQPKRRSKFLYNGIGRGRYDGVKRSSGLYTTPGAKSASEVGITKTSRKFSPDIANGAILTFTDGTCQQNSTGGFASTSKTHATGDTYELQGTSGTWEAVVEVIMLVDAVPTYTFTITTIADPATLNIITDISGAAITDVSGNPITHV